LKFFKKLHWFEITLITIVMGVHIYAAFSAPHNFPSRWFIRDDAYYYFKVAQNISEGLGSSCDGINLTNGYHPLWLLVCVPIFSLARFDLILPLRILVLVMAALSAVTSILLFRLLRKHTGTPAAMLAASFWAFSLEVHSIVTQQGMETGVVALSVVLFLYLLQKIETMEKPSRGMLAWLGLAALFVLFSRLDGIFLVMLAGIWVVFKGSPIRYLLPLDLIITFSIIVAAYIQRASLPVYLVGFDNSAILFTAIAFIAQTIVFYFIGLYIRPATLPIPRIIIMGVVGVTLAVLISTGFALAFVQFDILVLPRAVPVIFWGVMLVMTLLTRLGIRFISPWPVVLSRDIKPAQGFLAGKNHLIWALEPLSKWLRDGIIFFGIAGTGLLIYMGMNLVMFDTYMPVSGQVKRWWGSLPNNVYGGGSKSILDVFGIDPALSKSWAIFLTPINQWVNKSGLSDRNLEPAFWLVVLAIIGAWLILFLARRRRNLHRIFLVGIIPLMISSELHVLFYGAVAYSARQEWYWVMQMLALVILGALGVAFLIDYLPRTKLFQYSTWGLVLIASFYMAYGFAYELVNRMPYQDPLAGQPFMDTLPILEGYTPAGSLIGMTGGGNTGYFIKDRTIINMDGLINSYPYFQALKNNLGGKFLASQGLKYIFANKYIITSSMPYRTQFSLDELIPVMGAPLYGQKELMQYVPFDK